MAVVDNSLGNIQASTQNSMISALKLSPSCMCSDELLTIIDNKTTLVIDVRKAQCSKKYSSLKKGTRLPYDTTDVVSYFLNDNLECANFEEMTHFIFVCDHGYRSENIARQLTDKGVEGVYHLCGGYEHHEIELSENVAILARHSLKKKMAA